MHCDKTVNLWVVGDAQPAQLRSPIRSLFDKYCERVKQTAHHRCDAAVLAFDLLFCNSFHGWWGCGQRRSLARNGVRVVYEVLFALPFRNVFDTSRPAQCRAAPNLQRWNKLMSLSDASDSQPVRRRIVGCTSVKRRSATRAESLHAPCSAGASLDIDLWRPRLQLEIVYQRGHRDSKRRSCQRLAICAMTDRHARRVDDRLVGYVATVAGTLYFHQTAPPSAPSTNSVLVRIAFSAKLM